MLNETIIPKKRKYSEVEREQMFENFCFEELKVDAERVFLVPKENVEFSMLTSFRGNRDYRWVY